MAGGQPSHAVPIAEAGSVVKLRPLLGRVGRPVQRNPTMAAGIGVVVAMVLVAILAPLLFTGHPTRVDPFVRLTAPSAEYWFGTDNLGRDVYARTIYGARVSMIVAFSVAIISLVSGCIIGLTVGYYRKVDAVVMRVMDGLISIPSLLLGMTLMALLGGSVQNVIIALCVVQTPWAVRVVRSSVLSLREQMFVDAARAIGVPTPRILARHILPNMIAPLVVMGTYIGANAILAEASLSFLGVGPPPEVASWGNVMGVGRHFISRAVWVIFFPGVFLTLTVLAVNLAGDGLRDTLDPKLRRPV